MKQTLIATRKYSLRISGSVVLLKKGDEFVVENEKQQERLLNNGKAKLKAEPKPVKPKMEKGKYA